MRTLLAIVAAGLLAGAENTPAVERFTLTDGRTLVGTYNEATSVVVVSDGRAMVAIPVKAWQIAKREVVDDADVAATPPSPAPPPAARPTPAARGRQAAQALRDAVEIRDREKQMGAVRGVARGDMAAWERRAAELDQAVRIAAWSLVDSYAPGSLPRLQSAEEKRARAKQLLAEADALDGQTTAALMEALPKNVAIPSVPSDPTVSQLEAKERAEDANRLLGELGNQRAGRGAIDLPANAEQLLIIDQCVRGGPGPAPRTTVLPKGWKR